MVGALASDHGGEGLDFYGIREYRAGDPANRIHWRQYAETNELTTVEYQRQKAVEVVVIVDARSPAAVAASDTAPTGVELDVYAASEAVGGLLNTRNRVGLVTLGVGDDTGGGFGWIPPGNGHALQSRIRTRLDSVAATTQSQTPAPVESGNSDRQSSTVAAESVADTDTDAAATTSESPGSNIATDEIVDLVSSRTQLIMFSPLCDALPVEIAQQLQTAGYTVSVCAPDVTAPSTAGSTLTGIDRGLRLAKLRATGATVVDWSRDDPLSLVLKRTATALSTESRSYP
jgi:Uncharacterized conserved protein (some members contain a von Willebrand factor type A (vWA) domain)